MGTSPYPGFQEVVWGLGIALKNSDSFIKTQKLTPRFKVVELYEDIKDIKKNGYIDEEKRDFGYINDKGDTTSYKGKYTDPLNPLYKFIAYHIIDRKLLYSSSRGPGGFIMENYYKTATKDDGTESIDSNSFDSEENMPKDFDRYEYYRSSSIATAIHENFRDKYCTKEVYDQLLKDEIVINYAQEMGERCLDPKMRHHINVVVEDQSTARSRPGLNDFISEAVNGYIYTIDKILVYDETEMAGNILDERMRWDVFSQNLRATMYAGCQ